ncbi:MAG: hypothetical protein KKA62_02735 [Nanoarchaeota archaeon]|nr:hypothetical protein [Nanoarchaeota archaeon]MBU1644554.1 hypothetical protein [Nanoarchaeota archaeon]MBU1976847.1 hypothetical protein [Nanoarchaeota archaeon]
MSERFSSSQFVIKSSPEAVQFQYGMSGRMALVGAGVGGIGLWAQDFFDKAMGSYSLGWTIMYGSISACGLLLSGAGILKTYVESNLTTIIDKEKRIIRKEFKLSKIEEKYASIDRIDAIDFGNGIGPVYVRGKLEKSKKLELLIATLQKNPQQLKKDLVSYLND